MKYRLVLIFTFLIISIAGISQIKLSSYSIYALGISESFGPKISSEIKVFTNKGALEYTDIELSCHFNFKPREFHQFSIGAGFGMMPITVENPFISLPLSLQIFPIQSCKRLSLVIEAAPELYLEDGATNLRHLWGIRYSFKK